MGCPNNCGHYGCIIDKLHDEKAKLREELEETRTNLASTQVWLICSFVTCILMMIYSVIGK